MQRLKCPLTLSKRAFELKSQNALLIVFRCFLSAEGVRSLDWG